MVEPRSRRRSHRVSQTLMVIGAIEGAAALAAGGSGQLGWVDVALFGVMYAVPALIVGRALDSDNQAVAFSARVVGLVLAVLYSAVVAGNWSGYDRRQTILVPLLTAPVVAAYLAAFATGSSRPPRRPPPRSSSRLPMPGGDRA